MSTRRVFCDTFMTCFVYKRYTCDTPHTLSRPIHTRKKICVSVQKSATNTPDGMPKKSLAERVGFEPTVRFKTDNALAGRPIRPLWHLSWERSSVLAERKGFEPPGLLALPLSRRVHLSALPPFRCPRYLRRAKKRKPAVWALVANIGAQLVDPIVGLLPTGIGMLAHTMGLLTRGWI